MQPGKKQLEILLMQYFRECHPNFPKGKLVPSESPDFVLNLTVRRRIGIELTRLTPENATMPTFSFVEQQKRRKQIIETAKNLFYPSSSLKLFVKFQFSETIPIEEARELTVTVRITQAIRNAVQGKKAAGFFYAVLDKRVLPLGLENILIVNHPSMRQPVWELSNPLGISDDVPNDIGETIRKKDEKLALYHRQNLNTYWLVIVADQLRSTANYHLHNRIANHVFHSHFQRVFLFELIRPKVFQLV